MEHLKQCLWVAALLLMCAPCATSQLISAVNPRTVDLLVYGDTLTLQYYTARDSTDLLHHAGVRYPVYLLEARYFRAASEVISSLGRSVMLGDNHMRILESQRAIYTLEIDQLRQISDMSNQRIIALTRERNDYRQAYDQVDLLLQDCLQQPKPRRWGWVTPTLLGAIAGILTTLALSK